MESPEERAAAEEEEREAMRDLMAPWGWVTEGVQRLMMLFDQDLDGVLNVHEMNALQQALNNGEEYTETQFLQVGLVDLVVQSGDFCFSKFN